MYLALYLFVATMQFEGLDWLGVGVSNDAGNFTISKLAGLVLTCFALLNVSRWLRRISFVFIAICCYFGLVVVVALANGLLNMDKGYIQLLSPLQFGFMFLILSGLLVDEGVRNKCILIFSLAGAAAALLVLLGVGHPEGALAAEVADGARATQSNVDPNWFCLQLGLSLVGLLGCLSGLLKAQWWLRSLAGVLVLPICVAIATSGSRGGIIAATVGLVFFCLLPQHGKWRFALIVLVALCLLLIVAVALQIPETAARIQMTLDSGYTSGRDTIAEAALGLFEKQPILGYGAITAWKALGESLGLATRDSHNLVIQTALEGGVVGMLVYWITMGYCGFQLLVSRHQAAAGVIGALFVVLMAGNMGVNYQITKEHWFVMSLVVGCITPTRGTVALKTLDSYSRGNPGTA